MVVLVRCYDSHLSSRTVLKKCLGQRACMLLEENASRCRAVAAISVVFGITVERDTCCGSDPERLRVAGDAIAVRMDHATILLELVG